MSPHVVVSDSSVLIDLERGCLFDAAFALPLDFCVPDLLYRRELEPYGGRQLVDKGLRVLELDGDGVAQAVRYRQTERAISLSDAFALVLARRTGSTLLTGDARLRRLAVSEKPTLQTAEGRGQRCKAPPRLRECQSLIRPPGASTIRTPPALILNRPNRVRRPIAPALNP